MKAILISIKPEWVSDILNGYKTVEIRKTAPKSEDLPIDVYIYCTEPKAKNVLSLFVKEVRKIVGRVCEFIERKNVDKPGMRWSICNGKVVAKFTLRKAEKLERYTGVYIPETILHTDSIHTRYSMEKKSCLSMDEIWEYTNGNGYAWHISDLVIFDEPKKLGEFMPVCSKKKCNGCKYFGGQHEWDIVCNHPRPLSKAPQSWCYVEVAE